MILFKIADGEVGDPLTRAAYLTNPFDLDLSGPFTPLVTQDSFSSIDIQFTGTVSMSNGIVVATGTISLL